MQNTPVPLNVLLNRYEVLEAARRDLHARTHADGATPTPAEQFILDWWDDALDEMDGDINRLKAGK